MTQAAENMRKVKREPRGFAGSGKTILLDSKGWSNVRVIGMEKTTAKKDLGSNWTSWRDIM